MNAYIVKFSQQISNNFGVSVLPIADGCFHRFDDPNKKAGNRACWYRFSLSPYVFGYFGNWRTGEVFYFTGNNADKCPHKSRQSLAKISDELEKQRKQKQVSQELAAKEVRNLWDSAKSASQIYPYLLIKQVKPYDLRMYGSTLLIPIFDGGDRIVNIQKIYPDGSKRFSKGCKIKGCFSPIGSVDSDSTIYLCEGWATGATLHSQTNMPVFCALNCNNLLPVAKYIKDMYPNNDLVVAGDDDRLTKGNPGRKAALSTAISVGAKVIFPTWALSMPKEVSDFNDQYIQEMKHGSGL